MISLSLPNSSSETEGLSYFSIDIRYVNFQDELSGKLEYNLHMYVSENSVRKTYPKFHHDLGWVSIQILSVTFL